MYDPTTRSLIQTAPALDGLDLDRLPEQMTDAYATIVSFRLQLRDDDDSLPEELAAQIDRFRRLANTYESFTALLPEHQHRSSAAFVAASAHHLVNRADRLRADKLRLGTSLLRNSISSDVSALLLFLIAGYQADAAEMAKQLTIEGSNAVESLLLQALQGIAEGNLSDVLDLEIQEDATNSVLDADELATRELWCRLFKGVQELASALRGVANLDPIGTFRSVQADSVSEFSINDKGSSQTLRFVSAFAGPHQLATLLIQAGETLIAHSIINIPPPTGLSSVWSEILQQLAARRPYLWQNHLTALRTKVLDRGVSAVVSLPTGAGKTTMAELKIASSLASNVKIIYLVPTHALADQVKRQLASAFPGHKVSGSVLSEGYYAEIGEDDLPTLMVMTPERCLTLLGIQGVDFSELGLIVFDECHLMHPKGEQPGQRSIDSTLCLLKLLEIAPTADFFLMSAMLKNFTELAEWLTSATGRATIPLGIDWKPTRQARGCLVFDADEVKALEATLTEEKAKAIPLFAAKVKKGKRTEPVPGVAVKRLMVANPLGFFCLRQTWTKARDDYSLLPLAEGKVQLTANEFWRVTPNKNTVSVQIGSRLAALGIKTLVFIQNKGHCESVASGVAESLASSSTAPPFSTSEEEMMRVAIDETGVESAVLGHFDRLAVCHHGLLLPVERHLTESMFCRPDGPALLTATPTLAQGMNLPAEVVIINGEVRRESDSTATLLEAHELLNAAGRAGRAGHVADGVVLVIPDDVVGLDVEKAEVGGKWKRLQESIFAQSDQCLDIGDPLENILDLIQTSADPSAEKSVTYFARRLPIDSDGGDSAANTFLGKSLAAHRAAKAGTDKSFKKSVGGLLKLRKKLYDAVKVPHWLSTLSVSSGVSQTILESLDKALHSAGPLPDRSTLEWVKWFFEWLTSNPSYALELFDCGALNKVLKVGDEKSQPVGDYLDVLISKVQPVVRMWMKAETLVAIETHLGTAATKLGTCDRAREFVIRRIPEISYAVGLITQVHRGKLEAEGRPKDMPLTLATLAACIREGHRSPVHLAARYVSKGEVSRQDCQRLRSKLGTAADPASSIELFPALRRRVWKLKQSI